jgi:hypothetical protein
LIASAITVGASRVASGFLCVHAVATTPAGWMEAVRSYSSSTSAFPKSAAGRHLHHEFRGLLSVYSRYSLHARRVAIATLSIEGSSSFVTSTAASIATGWSEPVPGRVCLPLDTSTFSRRTRTISLDEFIAIYEVVGLCQATRPPDGSGELSRAPAGRLSRPLTALPNEHNGPRERSETKFSRASFLSWRPSMMNWHSCLDQRLARS